MPNQNKVAIKKALGNIVKNAVNKQKKKAGKAVNKQVNKVGKKVNRAAKKGGFV